MSESDPVRELKEKIERREFSLEDVKDLFDVLSTVYKEVGLEVRDQIVPANPVTKKVIAPEKWAKRQISRATAAAEDWLEGVRSPSRNPVEAAIAAEAKWVDKVQQAIKERRWVGALKKVSHADIVKVAEKLGTRVFTEGIAAREEKIKKVASELQPMFQAVSDSIQAMPDATDADREKRLLAARRLMIELGKKRRAT